mgnify:CR=1 FL=1
MKIMYIVKPGSKIHVKNDTVYLSNGDESLVITPEYDQVIIASSHIGLSSKAIRKLSSIGIDIVFLDSLGNPVARIYPPFINKTVATRIRQYEYIIVEKKGIEIAREFIYCKLLNQSSLLKYMAKSHREPSYREIGYQIESIADELKSIPVNSLSEEKIMEYESYGARLYWSAIESILPDKLGFRGRDPDGTDPFNMALNYGYGILYGVVEKALLIAGLDPYLGVLHSVKSGKPSLVLDFIEMFRQPVVDKTLLVNCNRIEFDVIAGKLCYETRKSIAKLVLDNLNTKYYYYKASKKMELSEIIRIEAWDLAGCFRELRAYKGFRVVY